MFSPLTPAFTDELPLIIDHDSSADDVIATTLQVLYNPNRIKAITITPADCYAHPATFIMARLKKLFVPKEIDIPIGIGDDEGVNLFPSEWRACTFGLAQLPVWRIDNEENVDTVEIKSILSPVIVLTKVLKELSTQVDILETGPCTNIAQVLKEHPEFKNKIHCIYMMGGALYIRGNVTEIGRDGSAEWNIYNNPMAFLELLKTKIYIKLISLDATQYTPVKSEFIAQVGKKIAHKPCQLVYESLKMLKPFVDTGQYCFWDVLTSASVIDPKIVKMKKVKINVKLNGPSMGKIFEDNNGFEVEVAIWADQKLFEKTILDILSKDVYLPRCKAAA
jgi:purine nucleosidase